MKILQVVSSTRTSGAEKHIVVLSEGLRERGHEILAVCPPGGWLPGQLRGAGIPVIETPMNGLNGSRAALTLRKAVVQNQVDVIHTHLTRATYVGYCAGLMAKVPVISTVHVFTPDIAYRWLPRQKHWFVAVSEHVRQALLKRGLLASRVHTVYNGTEFRPEERLAPHGELSVRAELGLPADAELVGLFGRVDTFKGHQIVVRAARSIVDRCPRAHFVFVGPAESGIQQALWEIASSQGVEDRLRFTGVRDDVPRLLAAMDVATLPSETEACSMAIIEAMAMGKPVVATRAGGNPELIVDSETGFLIERTPEALAQAVVALLQDSERRIRFGKAALGRAESMFSAPVMAKNMEAFYKHVLSGSHP